jgi:MFS family permease
MRQTLVSLTAMFVSLALLVCGTTLLGTLLSLRLAAEGLSTATIGAVLVFHSIGFVLGTRVVTRLIRRVGQIRSFAAFAAVSCAVALVHPNFVWAPLWALLRVASGFCMAGMVMILESWISGRASSHNRGTLLGIYQLVYFSFSALGQFLIGMTDPGQLPVFSLAAALIVLALVPLSLTREEAPTLPLGGRMKFRDLFRASPSAFMGAMAGGAISAGFLAMAPVYGYEAAMAVDRIALYLTVAVLGAMALQWPFGRLSDLFERRRVLGAFAVSVGVFAALLALVGDRSTWLLFGLTVPVFGITGCFYPVCLSMLNDRMASPDPVGASASLLFVFGLGTCVGPLLAAGSMALLGPHGLFLFLAVTATGLAAVVSYRMRVSDEVPVDQQGRFVAVPAADAGPAIVELDPRIEPGDAPAAIR